jgi:pyruvate/2-oxoglutarate/acetoin dehydrogenase E1 component
VGVPLAELDAKQFSVAVTTYVTVHHALEVAESVAGEGIDVEVIDLRSWYRWTARRS